MAVLFSILVSIVIAGWLWFYIARPILEDFGVIKDEEGVKHIAPSPPVVMSRSPESDSRLSPSSLQTDSPPASDRQQPGRAELLTLYMLLRAANIPREKARPALKAVGVPLDNNLWVEAAPPEEEYRTPIAGRPSNARYYDNPELEYQHPPN